MQGEKSSRLAVCPRTAYALHGSAAITGTKHHARNKARGTEVMRWDETIFGVSKKAGVREGNSGRHKTAGQWHYPSCTPCPPRRAFLVTLRGSNPAALTEIVAAEPLGQVKLVFPGAEMPHGFLDRTEYQLLISPINRSKIFGCSRSTPCSSASCLTRSTYSRGNRSGSLRKASNVVASFKSSWV